MKLTIRARKGHFDFLHPNEESISVHMNIDNDREKTINMNFDSDESLIDYLDDPHTWADTAVRLIDRYNKTRISSTNEKASQLKKIILENQKDIDINRLREVLEEKRAKMLQIAEELGPLEKEIQDLLFKSLDLVRKEGKE